MERLSVGKLCYAAALLMALAACSSGDSKTPAADGSKSPLTLTAHDEPGPGSASAIQQVMKNVKYGVTDIKVKAGRFEVHLVNQENPPPTAFCAGAPAEFCYSHDMYVTDTGGKLLVASATVKPGKDGVFVIDDLPAGSYVFYCNIRMHVSDGMKGTITATA